MTQQQITEKFIKSIESSFKDFDKTKLKEPLVGFSLRGEYPDWLIKKLKVPADKIYRPFLYLYLGEEITKLDELKISKVPIILKIDFLLKDEDFFDGEIAYVFNNKYVGNKLFLPINFQSDDEFFYDTKKRQFFHNCNLPQEITLEEIYEKIMRLHIASYFSLVGFRARTKIFFKRQLPLFLINVIAIILGLLHWVVDGIMYTYDPIMAQLTNEVEEKTKVPEEKNTKEEIDFFGYKVKVWTIGSYSFVAITTFLIWHLFGKSCPPILKTLLGNNFSAILFAIFTIIIYDSILPPAFKGAIRKIKEFNLNKILKNIKLSI